MKKINKGYGVNELPSMKETIPFSIQHALLGMFQALPAPLLISAGLGFSAAETGILVSCALFICGIASILQSFGIGPAGARLPMMLCGSFVFIAPALLIAPTVGFDGYLGACLVGSVVCGVVFVLFSDKLKVIFPPFVTGAVVMVLGASLIGVAINYCAGGVGSDTYGDPMNFLIAGITLLIVLACNLFGKGFIKGVSPLLGIVIGFIICAFLGMVDFTPIEEAAWIGLPEPLHWGLSFPIDVCITISFLAIVGVVELLGDTSATTMISEKRLPTKQENRGGVLAQAISSALSALFNGVPTITASANVGLLGLTRVYSRYVVTGAGILLVLCGLCPKLSAICSVIPTPVFGGAVLMTFGIIMVNGMKIIMDSKPNTRAITILAISLSVGLGFNAFPDCLAAFPFWVPMILSGVPGTAFTAVILNLIIPKKLKNLEEEDQTQEDQVDGLDNKDIENKEAIAVP